MSPPRLFRAFGAVAPLALALLALGAPPAHACSCFEIPFATEFAATEAVFTARALGQVDAAPEYPGMHYELLEVEAIWKGTLEPIVQVLVPDDPSLCGFSFDVDGDYLVFATRFAPANPLETHLCTRTRRVQPGDPIFDELGPPLSTPALPATWGAVKAAYR